MLTDLTGMQKRVLVGLWQTEQRWRPNVTLERLFRDIRPYAPSWRDYAGIAGWVLFVAAMLWVV